MDKKHKQFILAIDKSYVETLLPAGFSTFSLDKFIDGTDYKDLASHLVLRERHHLEEDKNYLQVLNYIRIKQRLALQDGAVVINENCYSTYYRKRGGEDRLKDKMSIGWGGHTDVDMVVWEQNAIDLLATLKNNIYIEIGQECIFRFEKSDAEYPTETVINKHMEFQGFINDMSDDVGQHHLAFVWEIALPSTILVESREDENKLGPMCSISELVAMKTERPALFENWSNILIDELGQNNVQVMMF